MKRLQLVPVAVLFSTLLFFSCSNTTAAKIVTSDGNNLREQIQNKESSINWTKPLEEGRLSQSIDKDDNVSSSIKLIPEITMILKGNYSPVYPLIENFESLDTSELLPVWRDIVRRLYETLNTNVNEYPENMIDERYLFNYVFFINDMKDQWKENFGEDFKGENSFSKYLIGKPFANEEFVQLPVMLYAEKGTVSINVFFRNDGKFLINQIEISGWGSNYGK